MIGAEFQHHDQKRHSGLLNQDASAPPAPSRSQLEGVGRNLPVQELRPQKSPMVCWPWTRIRDRRARPLPDFLVQDYGKGRVFNTSLGHREDIWTPTPRRLSSAENSKEVPKLPAAHPRRHRMGFESENGHQNKHLFGALHAHPALPFAGLILDLDADHGLTLADGDRATRLADRLQISGEGFHISRRKGAGTRLGAANLAPLPARTRRHTARSFLQQELVCMNETPSTVSPGAGGTWSRSSRFAHSEKV